MNYRKRWEFDRLTQDYALYIGDELIGFARTAHEAEQTLNEIVYDLLRQQRGADEPQTRPEPQTRSRRALGSLPKRVRR